MSAPRVNSTLINRDGILSTLWSTVQQIVVAFSTFFIVQAIKAVSEGDLSSGIRYICAFVACLILVYIPNTLSFVYLQKWRLSSVDSFVQNFANANFGRVTSGHDRNKAQSESWLTSECFTVYDQVTNLLYQMFSTFMNAVLNIIVIAAALDQRILLWYAAAGATLVGANHFSDRRLAVAAVDVQESRKHLTNAMLTAWDNIFLGNQHCFKRWLANYENQLERSRDSAVKYDLVRSVISSGAVTVALIIVAAGNGVFLNAHRLHLPSIAALFITLPRQLQIIQSIFSFFNLTLSWKGLRVQLGELQNVLDASYDDGDSLKFVDFSAIKISNADTAWIASNFSDARKTLLSRSAGRFTLRGRNGAGKSTLLRLLKANLGRRAFYLPTRYSELSFKSPFLHHSDGNRLFSVFEEIRGIEDIDYVILDEWDANLDARNVALIGRAIDQLALSKIVIESRHRS